METKNERIGSNEKNRLKEVKKKNEERLNGRKFGTKESMKEREWRREGN